MHNTSTVLPRFNWLAVFTHLPWWSNPNNAFKRHHLQKAFTSCCQLHQSIVPVMLLGTLCVTKDWREAIFITLASIGIVEGIICPSMGQHHGGREREGVGAVLSPSPRTVSPITSPGQQTDEAGSSQWKLFVSDVFYPVIIKLNVLFVHGFICTLNDPFLKKLINS